jgi:FMN-dependent NADH-azoreductase
MKNILLITSSPRGEESNSTQVATQLAHEIGGNLTVRELWRHPETPINPFWLGAAHTPDADRTPEQKAAIAVSDEALAELFAADIVIVAAGMINFGIPATLKTWIDHITMAGRTFQYTDTGPVGLVHGKKLILVLAAGGVYSAGPFAEHNHLEPVLKSNLGFLGLTDMEVIWMEGFAYGEEAAKAAIAGGKEKATALAATLK